MAEPQDNQTSLLKVTRKDLTDPEVYRLNQVINHLQVQINEIRRDARLYGNLEADSISAKLVDGIPNDTDVIPWGTIKRFLSPASNRTQIRIGSSTSSASGNIYLQEITLTANTAISASVLPAAGDILIQYITQGAGPYTISFDPAEFAEYAAPPSSITPEDQSVSCFIWCGRSDGYWWPISWPLTGLNIP
jgi:hypothetical protein